MDVYLPVILFLRVASIVASVFFIGKNDMRISTTCSIIIFLLFANPIYANNSTDFCFSAIGEKFNIDPLLLEAISYVESRNNPLAISHNQQSIDYGHMQINSYWIKYLGVEYIKLNNPCFCTKVGAAILSNCIDVHGFNKDALSCYNSGKKLDSLKPEVKTKVLAYIGSVKNRYNHLVNTPEERID